MTIIGALDTAKRVAEAAFGHFASYTKRREVRARRAPEIVEREVRQPVLHALQGDVQGVDAHMRYPLPWIAAALREDVLAACGERAQGVEPSDHSRRQGDIETLTRLGA